MQKKDQANHEGEYVVPKEAVEKLGEMVAEPRNEIVVKAIESGQLNDAIEKNKDKIASIIKGSDPLKGLSIGRIVIFTAATKQQFPAIVVRVVNPQTGVIDVQIFCGDKNGSELYRNLPFSETPKSDTWCWPQRV
jgi:phosphosulfolactate synthase (CoM biosynthesis protein A)